MSQLLNENVLALNKYYLAMQVIPAREAIKILANGKAVVVDEAYNRYSLSEWNEATKGRKVSSEMYAGVLHSPSTHLFVPQVIMILDCEHNSPLKKAVRYSRKNIYERDADTCQYCGVVFKRSELTVDHVLPRAKGGKSTWLNIVACCSSCNSEKADRTLDELDWSLLREPFRPKWQSHIKIPFDEVKKEYWSRFLT